MKQYKALIPELEIKYKTGSIHKVQIKSSADAAEFFWQVFNDDTIEAYESVMVVYLNVNSNTIGWFKASQGGLSGTIVDIKLILSTALKCLASGIILAHNHPSGDSEPSMADIKLTKQLKKASELLDIRLLDHIILTKEDYSSLADLREI